MAAPEDRRAAAVGIYAVASALLLLLLLTATALHSGTVLGVVAVLACGGGWGLSWTMARWQGGRPWQHALGLVALPLMVELYGAAAHDAGAASWRAGWLALLAVTAAASALGAWRGLSQAR